MGPELWVRLAGSGALSPGPVGAVLPAEPGRVCAGLRV